MRSSDLADKISHKLLREIMSKHINLGSHVSAQQLADRYGVSRTPVREALQNLEGLGVLNRQANRGYFVADKIPDAAAGIIDQQSSAATDAYHQLADDWLMNEIPEEVTEQFLRQKYGWTKTKVSDVLSRASREGWSEPKQGYGWKLLPVAKTPEAFDEIYRFRMAIEPAAMLEPTFELDKKVIDEQRRVQEGMLELDGQNIPAESLLENGSIFHEELIKLSGNPFFLLALQRVNRMRRLMEYRAEINWDRLVEQCTEHLEILSLLEKGNTVDASYRMRQHLSGALKRKSPIAWDWANDKDQIQEQSE